MKFNNKFYKLAIEISYNDISNKIEFYYRYISYYNKLRQIDRWYYNSDSIVVIGINLI